MLPGVAVQINKQKTQGRALRHSGFILSWARHDDWPCLKHLLLPQTITGKWARHRSHLDHLCNQKNILGFGPSPG